jgi:hypothetical protein
VVACVAGKKSRPPRRLLDRRQELLDRFIEEIKQHESERAGMQEEIEGVLPYIQRAEKGARTKAGYRFD